MVAGEALFSKPRIFSKRSPSLMIVAAKLKLMLGAAMLIAGVSFACGNHLSAQELPTLNGNSQPPAINASIAADRQVRIISYEEPALPQITYDTIGSEATQHENNIVGTLIREAESLGSREGTSSSIKLVLLLGALSLAPAILLMTTSYIRIIVVLSLLRQAFGGQQLPPNQVLTALSLFLTLLVMTPVWNEVKTQALDPYSSSESIEWEEAFNRGIGPVKNFMGRQIEIANNGNTVEMFWRYLPDNQTTQPPTRIEDVPLTVLLPSFILSELKVAFLLGFQIFLPFLVLDLVVSTVTVSMGMLMLPPTMVSFPLKLILFVMVDGWSLVVGMLLQSFGPFT